MVIRRRKAAGRARHRPRQSVLRSDTKGDQDEEGATQEETQRQRHIRPVFNGNEGKGTVLEERQSVTRPVSNDDQDEEPSSKTKTGAETER